MKPKRIQLSRKKGFKLPENAVNVARPGPWGNPFKVGPDRTRAQAVYAFRTWLTVDGCTAGLPERKQWILDHIGDLRGKDLACWCRLDGKPCHASTLLEIANK